MKTANNLSDYKITATPQEIVEAIKKINPYSKVDGDEYVVTLRMISIALSTLPRHSEREASPAPEALVERLANLYVGLAQKELLSYDDIRTALTTALQGVEDELVDRINYMDANGNLTVDNITTAIRSVLKGGKL